MLNQTNRKKIRTKIKWANIELKAKRINTETLNNTKKKKIRQENITIFNTRVFKSWGPKYIEQYFTVLLGEINKLTISNFKLRAQTQND